MQRLLFIMHLLWLAADTIRVELVLFAFFCFVLMFADRASQYNVRT